MNDKTPEQPTVSIARELIESARLFSLLAGALVYALGAGIAAYLGETIDWSTYFLGQGAVTMLQLSSYWLNAYFERTNQDPFQTKAPRRSVDGKPEPPRVIFLQVAAAALTAGAVLTVLLAFQGELNPAAFLILGIAFILGLVYAVPPVRLAVSGYGELVTSVLVANLFPALAYLLQAGDLHPLLAQLTFPLTFLFLAATLALALPAYYQEFKLEKKTMMQRLGWQRGMSLHNFLIAAAYLLLSASVIGGLEWRLAFPAFLSLPVAIFQIWQINHIANGGKPRWRMLTITAMATVGLAAYFMNLALWIV